MKKELLPNKEDFQGWIKHLGERLNDNARVKVKDNAVSYPDALKLLRGKLYQQFYYLKDKEERLGRYSFGMEEALEECKRQMDEWKKNVWKHFDLSQEVIKKLSKEEQEQATIDLSAFGGFVATGRYPKNYSSLIFVANMLVAFLRDERWPGRRELSERLNCYGHDIKRSTLAACLESLKVADFVRDNQNG